MLCECFHQDITRDTVILASSILTVMVAMLASCTGVSCDRATSNIGTSYYHPSGAEVGRVIRTPGRWFAGSFTGRPADCIEGRVSSRRPLYSIASNSGPRRFSGCTYPAERTVLVVTLRRRSPAMAMRSAKFSRTTTFPLRAASFAGVKTRLPHRFFPARR